MRSAEASRAMRLPDRYERLHRESAVIRWWLSSVRLQVSSYSGVLLLIRPHRDSAASPLLTVFGWVRIFYVWVHIISFPIMGCENWPIPSLVAQKGVIINQALEFKSLTFLPSETYYIMIDALASLTDCLAYRNSNIHSKVLETWKFAYIYA